MKNKKLAIIISIVLMVIVVASTTLWLLFKDNNKVRTTENTYTAYVNINPLIKLSFKVSCQNDDCTEPIITDTELVNEDAKRVYKDLVLENKSLKESIQLLANTVKDNDIAFKEVHIYTNYDNENEFTIDSIDYEIKLDIKKDEEFKQVIDSLITEDANKKTKEILVPVTYSKYTAEHKLGINDFTPLEHEELFTRLEYKFDEENVTAQPFVYIKITVEGLANIIDTLPEQYIMSKESSADISGLIDTTGLDIGTYKLPIKFISKIDGIEILTPSIECQLKIVSWDDRHLW